MGFNDLLLCSAITRVDAFLLEIRYCNELLCIRRNCTQHWLRLKVGRGHGDACFGMWEAWGHEIGDVWGGEIGETGT